MKRVNRFGSAAKCSKDIELVEPLGDSVRLLFAPLDRLLLVAGRQLGQLCCALRLIHRFNIVQLKQKGSENGQLR